MTKAEKPIDPRICSISSVTKNGNTITVQVVCGLDVDLVYSAVRDAVYQCVKSARAEGDTP